MADNDLPYHCSDSNINKISKRKMVIFFKVFYDHRNELKVQEKDKNTFQKYFIVIIITLENQAEKINQFSY